MSKPVVAFTFANHMHWVDMEWLWGYHVLPGSIRDMLHYCRELGIKGGVNFDGVGYEKLAAEDPEALQMLREAIQEGTIEPVGCSYGQPYGLFHGGESNIRQLIYGARSVRRLLGVWPKTFWEEEFYFFPQLPQMLSGCGFTGASLYFQWTWHTPEVPFEEAPVVWWEGHDGTRILTATRNKMNLHQWPEDVDTMLADMAGTAMETTGETPAPQVPLVQQWVELMPSPDWMCRSEVLIPKMREFLRDERFDVRPMTLGEYLDVARASSPMEEESGLHKRHGAYLPHWTQEGGIYAVTFRLADALPKEVQVAYGQERERLRKLHEQGGIRSEALAHEYQRLYSEKVEKQLDIGLGSCVLRDPACARIVSEALRHFDSKRYRLHASCVMPNHVHVVVEPLGGNDLASIMHSWKSFTAHAINKVLGQSCSVWQAEYYDHLVRNEEDLGRQVAYVVNNPPAAGLVDWPWVYVSEAWANYRVEGHAGDGQYRSEEHARDGYGNHGRDARATIEIRKYSMDDFWHGLTLGKNGDDMRRRSRRIEDKLVSAEAGLTFLSLLGRPYPQWDVYPVWEFEEAWRRLLRSQHHDNCECEGLCAHVAKADYEWLENMCRVLRDRLRPSEPGGEAVSFNPSGWSVRGIEPFGFGIPEDTPEGNWNLVGSVARYESNWLSVTVDLDRAVIANISSPHFEDGVLREPISLVPVAGDHVEIDDLDWAFEGCPRVLARVNGNSYFIYVTINDDGDGVRLFASMRRENPGKGGYLGSNKLRICPNLSVDTVWIDTPYAVSEVAGKSSGKRKYPTSDWMTSPQWFEDIEGGLYASTFVDFRDEDRGLLICQDSPTQWFRNADGFEAVIGSYDPWDEHNIAPEDWKVLTLIPHGKLTNSDCWRRANERELIQYARGVAGSFLDCESSNVIVTALYREAVDFAGKHVENYAFSEGFQHARDGHGNHGRDARATPVVMRLVEFDGIETIANLTVTGQVARAYKTNLLGQPIEEISATISSKNCSQRHPQTGYSSTLQVPMRAHEIATIYLDIVEGRKVARDLDAKREIWAQVHRT